MTEPRIVVVGSLVMDLVLWLPHFPRKGETLHPSRFEMFAGGKGFNQAVTARRCGAQVSMAGRVGGDAFGDTFFQLMEREGIDRRYVTRDDTMGTSLGIPMIDPNGDNCIIGIPRANTRLAPEDVEAAQDAIAHAQVLLLQLEVPVAASVRAAQMAREAGAAVVLNPAPAHLPIDRFLSEGLIDWLIPNEVETGMISGEPVRDVDEARKAARAILGRGVKQGVIVTLGAHGSLAVTREGEWYAPPFPITPVDPTGAGDAFCGAFGVALAENQPIEQALRFANAAGALCAMVAGAEPSLPRREAVERLALSPTFSHSAGERG
jgi:ribokinase